MSTAFPPPPPLPFPPTGAAVPPEDDILAFTPVPHSRHRANGWTPDAQVAFIQALSVMGTVGMAARAVGMGRQSAYRLRERALALAKERGAEGASFVAAWDRAISLGRWRQYSVAMERAIEGHTIVRVHRGGSVSVTGGPDLRVMNAALREPPAGAVPPAPAARPRA